MVYCKKCGASVNQETGCCTFCGLHVDAYSPKKENIVLKISVALLVLLIALPLGFGVLNNIKAPFDTTDNKEYLTLAEDVVDAIFMDHDFSKMSQHIPESILQQKANAAYVETVEEFCNGMQGSFEQLAEAFSEKGIDTESIEWSIAEEVDLTGVQLKHYQDVYQEASGTNDTLKAAKALDIAVTFSNGEETASGNVFLLLGFKDDTWFIIDYKIQ